MNHSLLAKTWTDRTRYGATHTSGWFRYVRVRPANWRIDHIPTGSRMGTATSVYYARQYIRGLIDLQDDWSADRPLAQETRDKIHTLRRATGCW